MCSKAVLNVELRVEGDISPRVNFRNPLSFRLAGTDDNSSCP